VQDRLLDAYVGNLLKVDEQFVGLVEQFMLFSYLFQSLCLLNFIVYMVLQSLHSIVLLFPARDVKLCQFETFLDALFVSEILDGFHVGTFLFPGHDWKHLDVLDILEVEGSRLSCVEYVEVLVPGKNFKVVFIFQLDDGCPVENSGDFVLYVVLELLDLFFTGMLKGRKMEVVLCLVLFDLVLKI
jgi:hypothetical protein